jgi:hypothetical protein
MNRTRNLVEVMESDAVAVAVAAAVIAAVFLSSSAAIVVAGGAMMRARRRRGRSSERIRVGIGTEIVQIEIIGDVFDIQAENFVRTVRSQTEIDRGIQHAKQRT